MPRGDDLPFSPIPGEGSTPDDFFRSLIWHILTVLNVGQPATVVKWNPPIPGTVPSTVDLKMDFKYRRAIDVPSELDVAKLETLSIESWGLRAVGEWPIFKNCPYVTFGPPAFNIRGPIATGTTGLWIVVDRCLDQWLNTGGPLDPATADKHDINDGFFVPTTYHGLNTPTVDPLVHQLGPDDGTAGFEIATATDKSVRVFTDGPNATVDALTLVKLGEAAALGVARLTDTVDASAAMTTFMTQVVTALNTIAAAVPVVIVPPVPPTTIGAVSSASTKVQAE